MLHHIKDLQNLSIVAIDGAIGEVKDIYFDDEGWAIRYLVVETGSWLSSRKVLISPISAGTPDWEAKLLPVTLTCEQVKLSPEIDTEMPVTRQHETDFHDYFSYPYYWGGVGLWGSGGYPGMFLPGYAGYTPVDPVVDNSAKIAIAQARINARQRDNDPHLRSCDAVIGYHIQATDGEIGHVQGMLIDEESWAIRYLVVSTSNWWLGHHVLVAPEWIKHLSWEQESVLVDLTRDALKQAPDYIPALPLTREMEIAVCQYYGRAGYVSDALPALARVTPSDADD